jgi:hypothetical protein
MTIASLSYQAYRHANILNSLMLQHAVSLQIMAIALCVLSVGLVYWLVLKWRRVYGD